MVTCRQGNCRVSHTSRGGGSTAGATLRSSLQSSPEKSSSHWHSPARHTHIRTLCHCCHLQKNCWKSHTHKNVTSLLSSPEKHTLHTNTLLQVTQTLCCCSHLQRNSPYSDTLLQITYTHTSHHCSHLNKQQQKTTTLLQTNTLPQVTYTKHGTAVISSKTKQNTTTLLHTDILLRVTRTNMSLQSSPFSRETLFALTLSYDSHSTETLHHCSLLILSCLNLSPLLSHTQSL